MKKRKIFALVASVILVAAVGIGATLAYFTDSTTIENVVTMGHVDIDLTEPEYEKISVDRVITNIVPGQTITKDPTVTVLEGSLDAFIRVMVEFDGELVGILAKNNQDDTLSEEEKQAAAVKTLRACLNVDDDEWYFNSTSGYYYLKNKVEAKQSVTLFDEVTIPVTWDNTVAGQSLNISVTAEAIQADNFEPTMGTGADSDKIVDWLDTDNNQVTVLSY